MPFLQSLFELASQIPVGLYFRAAGCRLPKDGVGSATGKAAGVIVSYRLLDTPSPEAGPGPNDGLVFRPNAVNLRGTACFYYLF